MTLQKMLFFFCTSGIQDGSHCRKGSLWPYLHSSRINNYLCNRCLSPLIVCSNHAQGKVYNIMW